MSSLASVSQCKIAEMWDNLLVAREDTTNVKKAYISAGVWNVENEERGSHFEGLKEIHS